MRQSHQLLVARLHRLGHAVEAARQLADFIATRGRGARLVIARGQLVRARLQPGQPPDDQPVQQQPEAKKQHGVAGQIFDQALAPDGVHALLDLGLGHAQADDAAQIADPIVECRVVLLGEARGRFGAGAMTFQARRLDADRRGVVQVADAVVLDDVAHSLRRGGIGAVPVAGLHFKAAVVLDDVAHSLRRGGIGAEPIDGLHFKAVGHVARVARTIRHIVEADAAVAPVGKLPRDARDRVGGQESQGRVGDRQAALDELILIDAACRHYQGVNVAGLVFAFPPGFLGNFVSGSGNVHRQHQSHQQAEYEPDFFGEPHAASVSDGGGRAMTARKCGSIGLIRRYGAYTAIKRVNLAFSTCFNCFSI